MAEPAPQHEDILAALDKILGWAEIVRSPQLGRFLSYIVTRTLAGDAQAIKAYSIAVDVFGRPADFDPQADPIVRVQARRLRGLLEQYYQSGGLSDPVRILLPVGRYVPEFPMNAPEPEPASPAPAQAPDLPRRPPRGSITVSWFVLLAIALGIAALAYSLSTLEPRQQVGGDGGGFSRPSVTIVEFQNLSGDENRTPMVAGLAIELVTDLEQFEQIDVRYGGSGDAATQPAGVAASDFVLTGIMRLSEGAAQYSAILTESASGSVVWSHALSIAGDQAIRPGVLDDLARSLSLMLGSPRGPLHAPARAWLAAGNSLVGNESPYLCRILFDIYRETGGLADAEQATTCLEALPEADRHSAQGLAETASLAAEIGGSTPFSDGRYGAAEASLEQAIALAPLSGFVWEQRGRLYESLGLLESARAAYGSSIQLNPASADALASFSRLLALRGRLDEGLPMAVEAVEGSPSPPSWYYCALALGTLRDGDYAAAIEYAAIYALADREIGPIVAVMAALRAGDSGVVNRYLPQVLDVTSFRAQGILPQLRHRISDETLLAEIRLALTEAGVPLDALSRPF